MAIECLVTLPTNYRNVGEMVSSQYAIDQQNNRDYLLSVPEYSIFSEVGDSNAWGSR